MKQSTPKALRYFAIVLIGIAGIATASMKAIIVGSYVGDFGLSSAQGGYVLSAGMIAAAAGTLASTLLPAPGMLAAALALIFVGDFGTAVFASGMTLFVWQTVAGLGHGFALGRMAKAIAMVEHPARATGLYMVGYLTLSSACIYFLPNLQALFGRHALFIMISLTGLLGFAGLRWLPAHARTAGPAQLVRPPGPRIMVWAGASLFIYYVSIGGYWPFMSRFADLWGIVSATRLHILGIVQLVGLAGASISVFLGERFGVGRSLAVLLLLQSVAIATLVFGPPAAATYACSAGLYVFAWLAGFPYLLALVSRMDSSGRLNALLMIAANAAYAVGPAVAGLLINAAGTEASGLQHVQVFGLVLQVSGALLILLLAASHRQRELAAAGLYPAGGQPS